MFPWVLSPQHGDMRPSLGAPKSPVAGSLMEAPSRYEGAIRR